MESVSARVDDETYQEIESLADERGSSTSAVVRELLQKGMDYDDLADERERLQRQLAATNQRVDEHQDLVEYVQEERELEQRREQRRQAPAWKRARWWLLGTPDTDDEE